MKDDTDDTPDLTESQQRTLEAIRELARAWSLETQAKIIQLRMTGCACHHPPPSLDAILGALRAMDEVEDVVR